MSSIFFALISYIGWGAGDIFGAVSSRKIGSVVTNLSRAIIGVSLFSFYIPFARSDFQQVNLSMIAIIALLSLIGNSGLVFFYEALRMGSASIVGVIAGSFPAVVIVSSLVFFKETLALNQIAAIALIFVGVVIAGLDIKELRKVGIKANKGVVFAILAMITWGIYFSFIRIPVARLGWFWPAYIGNMFAIMWLIIYWKYKKIGITKKGLKSAIVPMVGNAIFLTGAEFSYNLAISLGKSAIVAPIAGSYPTLFVLLAFLILKDKINRQQVLGLALSLVGIVLLSVFSS